MEIEKLYKDWWDSFTGSQDEYKAVQSFVEFCKTKSSSFSESKGILGEIDEFLAQLEDYTHGKDGESITKIRGKITLALSAPTSDLKELKEDREQKPDEFNEDVFFDLILKCVSTRANGSFDIEKWIRPERKKQILSFISVSSISKDREEWIDVKERLPEAGSDVLVICDYTEYGRKKNVHIASVNYAAERQEYRGPNSLVGSGYLRGLFFALPAVMKPGIVTHWQPLPSPPSAGKDKKGDKDND